MSEKMGYAPQAHNTLMETDQASLLTSLATFFAKHTIPYMITGAWSVIFYGRPRASHDIDFVVELYPKDIDRVLKALDTLPLEFSTQKDAVREGIQNKAVFQIIHRQTLLHIDVWILTKNLFDQSRFQRRKFVTVLGNKTAIASAEDTILQKLRWNKKANLEKHMVDAAFVYQIQEKRLDKKYLHLWAKKLGLTKNLKQLPSINLEQYL